MKGPRAVRILTVVAAAALAGALLLLVLSTENPALFSRFEPWILLVNLCGALALGVLLTRKLWQLYRDFRRHVPGSRLTMRTVAIFGALVIAPLVIVYLFSLAFINRGIDSWFRVEIHQGLNDAVVLSRAALNLRISDQARRTENLAAVLHELHGAGLQQRLDQERRASDASQIVVYDANWRADAFSSATPLARPPPVPPPEVTLPLAAGHDYVSLNPLPGGGYSIETAAPISEPVSGAPVRRYVLIDYRVPRELSELAQEVQRTATQYGNLSALREPLKVSFRVTLTLVVLLTLLAAINGAVWSAERLTRPVQDLIAGTRAVGKGDFGTRLPLPSRDEMGFLVHSFNDMTKRLRRAREEATRSRAAVERERERLAVILSRLSSGVIVTDRDLALRIANESAEAILGAHFHTGVGTRLEQLAADNPRLGKFTSELRARLGSGLTEWREQLALDGESGGRVLLWACTSLPDEGEHGGVVIVFDDITALIAAQREAAWGEAARRLAHEIRNPLTPIQLAAERLHRRLLPDLGGESAQLLEQSTHTIVQQVEALKQMVNAFSEYARAPQMLIARFDLNQLVAEVAGLYRLQDPQLQLRLDLDEQLTGIDADRGRVRQVLANLIANGIEALAGAPGRRLQVRTRLQHADGAAEAVISVSDNGPGFRREVFGRLFVPYVTSKPRGTGLGLAIVKRIVEEHGGHIEAENQPEGGARIQVTLPVSERDRVLMAAGERRMELRRERA